MPAASFTSYIPFTSGIMNCMTPMPSRDPTVLKMVNMGRWLGSLVSTVWPARVQEVWKV